MTIVYTTPDHDTSLCHSPTEMIEETRYNGWSNYETWNVSLWIQNDEGLYNIAREITRGTIHPYGDFVDTMLLLGSKGTPDGVSWSHPNLSYDELNEMMEEL